MASRLGQQLGNYRLTELLGQGGFAEVYLGEHIHLGTQAAIKVLHTQLTSDDVDKFRAEARVIAHLIHPHIVRILEFGVEDKIPFLVMDYAPHGTLRQHHPKGVALPLATITLYVKQVAEALQYAHDEKIIHRDVKPENMLLGRRNEILLSDFGIALIAQSSRYQSTQDMAGTMAYMSPEQIQGKPRPASDQYSLGIVVYEWLSGDRPFHGSLTEMVGQHLAVPPPSLREKVPTISPNVEKVVVTALDKDPKQRFMSIQAFAAALEQASLSARRSPAIFSDQPLQPGVEEIPPTQYAWPSVASFPSSQPLQNNTSHLPVGSQVAKGSILRRTIVTVLVLVVLVVGASSLTLLLHLQQQKSTQNNRNTTISRNTASSAQSSTSKTLDVQANSDWQNSGVFVPKGTVVTIEYVSGYWRPWPGVNFDGRGCTQGCSLTNVLILVGCNHGGLIGRIGSSQMICILDGTTVTATESGLLYLRINDPQISDDSGAITVRITSG
jgi:serine/threonine protein kinase